MANTTTHKAQDTANKTADQAKNAVSTGAEKAKDTAHSAIDKTREAVNTGMEKAREMAGTAYDRTKDAAQAGWDKARDTAENSSSTVGGGMESLAGTVRDYAPGGMLGSAASTVADSLEQGGRYLREEGFSGMADDLTKTIRRNPIPSVLVAAAFGFLLARATRS